MLAASPTTLPNQQLAFAGLRAPAQAAVVLAVKNRANTIAAQVNQLLADGKAAVVVDEDSSDSTAEAAASAGAWVIQSNKDLPFQAAIHQGVQLAAQLGISILVMRAN